jgi:phage terminase large subunit-like protein
MAWCVGNAKVEQRANSILITKQASGTAKIDPLAATFNARDLMSLDPPHAHQFKRARRKLKLLCTRLGRIIDGAASSGYDGT